MQRMLITIIVIMKIQPITLSKITINQLIAQAVYLSYGTMLIGTTYGTMLIGTTKESILSSVYMVLFCYIYGIILLHIEFIEEAESSRCSTIIRHSSGHATDNAWH